jgi:Txe/YoeB family toxin of Txe-Axe toxin-antitoxin module
MNIKPLRKDLQKILTKHQLTKKFNKQIKLFQNNPRHPSLHTEKIEPKHLHIHSFRIDKKWRAIFIITQSQAEIIDINPHYQ